MEVITGGKEHPGDDVRTRYRRKITGKRKRSPSSKPWIQ